MEHSLGGFHRRLGPTICVWEVGATRVVCDVPILQPLMEHSTHHLWSSISSEVFGNVLCCTEVPQNCHQVLTVKLGRGGGDDGVPAHEPIGYHYEVVGASLTQAMQLPLVLTISGLIPGQNTVSSILPAIPSTPWCSACIPVSTLLTLLVSRSCLGNTTRTNHM